MGIYKACGCGKDQDKPHTVHTKDWFIDYRYPPGRAGQRVREKVGPAKDEARIILAERLQDIRQGKNPALRKVTPILFKDHAAEVLAKHYGAKRSKEWAELVIDKHLVPFFGEMFLGSIKPKAVTDYMAQRQGQKRSNGTINGERAVLSKIMSLAVEWERIHENPVHRVKKLERADGRTRFLSHDEADALVTKAPPHLQPVIITALETGGRLSEVLGLKWDDLDLDRGLLFFDQTNTKNAKQREIPMTPLLLATLTAKSKVRAISGAGRTYVFTLHGKRLRDIRTAFEVAHKRAGLGKDVTFHTLRHTFASWYVMRPGSDLKVLQELLGHQDMKTTMIYSHLSPDYKRAARNLIGRQPVVLPGFGGHLVDKLASGQREAQA
jgi:integrase